MVEEEEEERMVWELEKVRSRWKSGGGLGRTGKANNNNHSLKVN